MSQLLHTLTAGMIAIASSVAIPVPIATPARISLSSQKVIPPPVTGSNKPVAIQEYDPIQPPDELWRFVHNADAVAHVRIISTRTYLSAGAVVTEHTAQLLEGLKTHEHLNAAGNAITIVQHAGQADAGSKIVLVGSDTLLSLNEEYVLFLKWSPHLDRFEIFHGRFGKFRLANGSVDTAGNNSRIARTVRGEDREVFLSDLRGLATK